MCGRGILFNVNENIVKCGLESSYIRFVRDLNRYLLAKYPNFYLGLQLYRDRSIPNVFHVIAAYRDVPGIYAVAPIISKRIGDIYESVWGNSVQRTSIVSFLNSKKINL
ncbi:hypothetical protein SAMN02745196_02053 [Clostridium collagenovorans DSM 3089]|uniref:Antibiotic biosynthesis monooxygenase n=1 Tax=Clostridium collagenovorans DSM 3089 TaxID=1121306 RepID=A0A1M5X6P9_9CLOT|nr:hypothetical protein [Clostridium collagenovorans]SHH95471.1 hypothetical protein SAMN02745196_02053 [Clostridium collagenovorans DSM 3089]